MNVDVLLGTTFPCSLTMGPNGVINIDGPVASITLCTALDSERAIGARTSDDHAGLGGYTCDFDRPTTTM